MVVSKVAVARPLLPEPQEEKLGSHDLRILVAEESTVKKKKKTWFSLPKTTKLDALVLSKTKRRYSAYAEARRLQANILRAKGHVYDLTFEKEGDLGFSLLLSRDGIEGRAMITVHTVHPDCDHDLKVGDELLAIYDCLLIEPSPKDFADILHRIEKSMRPLKFTFALGARYYGRSPWTIPLVPVDPAFSSETQEADFQQQLNHRVKQAQEHIFAEARTALQRRAQQRLQNQKEAIHNALRAARKYASKPPNRIGQSSPEAQRRALTYLEEAKRLYAEEIDNSIPSKDSVPEPPSLAVDIGKCIIGAVVRITKKDTDTFGHNRIGMIISQEPDHFFCVRFTDSALNKSFSDHPAIRVQNGVTQLYRAHASELELLPQKECSEIKENTMSLAELARAERIADEKEARRSAYIFQAQQMEDPAILEDKASRQAAAAAAAETERHRQIRQAESLKRGEKYTRARIFVAMPLSAEEKAKQKMLQEKILNEVEAERRRQIWEHQFSHPGRGALVHVFDIMHRNPDDILPFKDDPAPNGYTNFNKWLYTQSVLCIDGTSSHSPSSIHQASSISSLVERALFAQRDSLLPPEAY